MLAVDTVALIAPKNTMFWSDVALKLFPVMVTKVPIIQLVERKRMMVGTCAYAKPTLSKVKTTAVNHNDICLFIQNSSFQNLSFDNLKIYEDRRWSNKKVREVDKFYSEVDIKWVNFQKAIP